MTDSSSQNTSQLPACDDCRKRKIRCDRRTPRCSNCERSKVPCLFTNDGKRPNTTKQLADDVAGLNSRLSAIDDTNAKLLQRIDALSAEIARSRQATPTNGTPAGGTPRGSFQEPEDRYSPRASDRMPETGQGTNSGNSNLVFDESGGELYYGATSTRALFCHARDEVSSFIKNSQQSPQTINRSTSHPSLSLDTLPITSASPMVISELQRRISIINKTMDRAMANQDEYEPRLDKLGLHLPPKELLDSSIDMFFEESNLERLIYQKDILLEAVEQHFKFNAAEKDEAWVLSFNNIVVLSLSYRSKVMRSSQYGLTSVDYDLLESRVEAAKQTLHRLDQFSKPRVINVQALLSLSLVVRKFFSFQVFERVFNRACQLAKDMGLQEGLYSDKVTALEREERKNLIWALYAVDKQRVVIKDVPCQLYLFEFNLDIPTGSGNIETSHQDSLAAQIRLTTILEELYKHLNSPQARRQDRNRRKSEISSLNSQLDDWWGHHQRLLTQCGTDGYLSVASLHLRYFFLTIKVLVHRASDDGEDRKMSLKYSTEALRIVKLLCSGNNLMAGGLLALDRLFRGCSIVAYYDVFSNVLNDRRARDQSDQLGLLAACTTAVGHVALPKYIDSYFARMHSGLSWCTDVLKIMQRAERGILPAPSAPETSAALSSHQFSEVPYTSAQFPQNQEPFSSEKSGSISAFPSSASLPAFAEMPSSVDFSSSTSSRTSSRVGLSDSSFGRGPMGSSSSATSPSNFGLSRPATAQDPSINAFTGSLADNSAEGNMDAMFIDPLGDGQGQPGPSTGDFPMSAELYEDLLRPNPFMDDQQFGSYVFP